MDRNQLYSDMEAGKLPGITSIAKGGLSTDLGKWAERSSAIFANQVLAGELPDYKEITEGKETSNLGKWAKTASELRSSSDMEKMIAGAVKGVSER